MTLHSRVKPPSQASINAQEFYLECAQLFEPLVQYWG
jgi:hypothetical protein